MSPKKEVKVAMAKREAIVSLEMVREKLVRNGEKKIVEREVVREIRNCERYAVRELIFLLIMLY